MIFVQYTVNNIWFSLQITPPTLCGSSTQYLTSKVMGPVGTKSLLKNVKFDTLSPTGRPLALQ